MNERFLAGISMWALRRPWLVRWATKAHVWIYQKTGGRLGGDALGVPVLLLHHVGRKTGREFIVPLYFMVDGPDLAVVASYGGAPTDPQWWTNLQAAGGRGRVQVLDQVFDVTATAAGPHRRERLYERFTEIYKPYDAYRKATTREIPVVLLRPVG